MSNYTDYKAVFSLQSSFSTPFQSDTILGHILWIIKYTEGDAAFQNVLQAFKNPPPPFVVSDAFPLGYVPAPLIKKFSIAELEERIKKAYKTNTNILSKEIQRSSALLLKHNSKISLIPLNTFKMLFSEKKSLEELILDFKICPRTLATRDACKPEFSEEKCPDFWDIPAKKDCEMQNVSHQRPVSNTKTSINRLTNTSLEGHLFEDKETFLYNTKMVFYIRIFNFDKHKLQNHLEQFSHFGYGKKASVGRGTLKLIEFVESDLPHFENPNALFSLSTFSPSADDPINYNAEIFTKYGKISNAFSPGNVWKHPMLNIKPGAIFYSNNQKEFLGGVVENCHPNYTEIINPSYAFTLEVPALCYLNCK